MHLFQRLHDRCACASASSEFVLAGTRRQYERARPFLVSHLRLDAQLDLPGRSISATATLDFERVSPDATQLELDAVGFDLLRVQQLTGRSWTLARHSYDGDRLSVQLPRRVRNGRIRIRYHAQPRRGLYFLQPDAQRKDLPVQLWSQCQDEDARHFIPCIDKPHMKMTTEVRIEVPAGFVALSNGEPVGVRAPRGTKRPWTYHFKMDQPLPSYLITLVVGRFDVIEDRAVKRQDGSTIPVVYYVPPGRRADALRAFGETPRMIELFSRLTGVEYPWHRYSQVVVSDFIFGGMENTTATTLYEHVLLDQRAAIDITSHDLVAHELAHQWFGNYVTCRDWKHAWLNEGFATYFEHVEREERLGRDEYDYGVYGDLQAYLAEASSQYQRPLVCNTYAQPIELFDRHLYEKGGLVLHMLRRQLGDTVFWAGVNEYLKGGRHRIVETNDLQRALESSSGQALDRFFEQWVYRAGHPILKVKLGWEDGQLSVAVRQAQKGSDVPVFCFPLEVEIATRRGPIRRYRKTVQGSRDALIVKLGERPLWVAVDPDLRIAGRLELQGPSDWLLNQLRDGSAALVRCRAAEALAKRSDQRSIDALGAALDRASELWMVRAECARSLGRIRGAASQSWLERGATAENAKVRRGVAAALAGFHNPVSAQLLKRMAERDVSYLVAAEACRALGHTRQPAALRTLLAASRRNSWAEVGRAGALAGLAALNDERALSRVIALSRYGAPPRARRSAISALAELSDARQVRTHLEDLLEDSDPLVRLSVVRALRILANPRSRAPLRQQLERERDGRVARQIREALRTLADGAAAERRQLRDELEGLRSDLLELKTRLSKLEGGAKRTRQAPRDRQSRPRPRKQRVKHEQ
jgi:aminopeptidase N